MSVKIKKLKDGRWHTEIEAVHSDGGKFRLTTNPGGCGSMILHGWAGSFKYGDNMKELLEYVLGIIRDGGHLEDYIEEMPDGRFHSNIDIGSIIFIAGESYYGCAFIEEAEKLGFKEVAEYSNPRHGSSYKQKMYIWTID